jgi:hypothetical protein
MSLPSEAPREDPLMESSRQRRRHGVGGLTVIQVAKAAVKAIDLADRLVGPGRMRRSGDRWVANCPLPGHASSP